MDIKITAKNYLLVTLASVPLCALPNALFASCSSSHEIIGEETRKSLHPQTSIEQLHRSIKDRMQFEERKSRTKSGKHRVKLPDPISRVTLENEKPLTQWNCTDLFLEDRELSFSDPARFVITHRELTEEDLHEILDFGKVIQQPSTSTQTENHKPATSSPQGLPHNKDQSHKLIFQRDQEGNPLHSKSGSMVSWKPFNESSLQEQLDLLMPELRTHMASRLQQAEHSIAYNAHGKDDQKKSLMQVGTLMGGGDCGLFAYGHQTSRSAFVNRLIKALLLPDTTPVQPGTGDRGELHSLITYDLFQRALLTQEDQLLKATGSKKNFEDLFKEGPEKARLKPYVLANFVYLVYAKELECLSIHMLKALAHMDGVNLCIWAEDTSKRDKQELPPYKTLTLVDQVSHFPHSSTGHIFFDGIGHFSLSIEDDNAVAFLTLQRKSLLSLALEFLLSKNGIGAQEYDLYTEPMKIFYQGLCA